MKIHEKIIYYTIIGLFGLYGLLSIILPELVLRFNESMKSLQGLRIDRTNPMWAHGTIRGFGLIFLAMSLFFFWFALR
jgi:uncharacterized membrane protein